MYTAAVLDEQSAARLRDLAEATLGDLSGFLFSTRQGQRLPHHMTINLGPWDESLNPRSLLTKNVALRIDGLVRSDLIGACAANVQAAICGSKSVRCANSHPHITICIMPWAKPKDSNLIFSQTDMIWLDASCELRATVLEL